MAKLTLQDVANLQNESTVVTALKSNNDLTEIAMENTLSRNGLAPNQMLSNLDMNNYKVINLPDAISDQEPATYSQLQEAIGAVEAGQVIDAKYVTIGNNGTLNSERALTAGTNLSLTDAGANSTVTLAVSDNELNALATTTAAADKLPYFNGATTATTTDFTPYARTLLDDADATTARATLGAVIGTNVQAFDADLSAVAGLSTPGLIANTGAGTAASRTLTAPAAGITITNPAGTAGNPTLVLANDLAAVEGLASNGMAARTATDTWTTRTITAPAAGITVTNGDGVAGNPTLVLANDLAAYEGLSANGMVARTATDTAAVRTITGTANEITLTNGDGVSGNPVVSIPTAVTFTGKTITGGSYATPALTGTPTSTTAAVDTNTTQIATTAFVVAQASGSNPLMDGSVAQGTSLRYSRQDHVHPVDTSRQAADVQLFSNIPQNSQSAAYTFVLTDGQKEIYHPAADTTARVWTIPANSSVAYPVGTVIVLTGESLSGVITLSITTDTLVWLPSAGTGRRTLTAPFAAAIKKITSTKWQLVGVGIS